MLPWRGVLSHTARGGLRSSLLFLFSLAWRCRLQLPALLTASLLILNARIRLQIDWEHWDHGDDADDGADLHVQAELRQGRLTSSDEEEDEEDEYEDYDEEDEEEYPYNSYSYSGEEIGSISNHQGADQSPVFPL